MSMSNLQELITKPFLTPEEVAQVLDVSLMTVYRKLKSGELPGAKIGANTWRIKQDDLNAFVEECKGGDDA